MSRLGDAALVVSGEQRIDPVLNGRVVRLARWLRARQRVGVRDVVESYCAVTVYFDPLGTDVDGLVQDVMEATRACTRDTPGPDAVGGGSDPESRQVTVPVCYGGEYGPDLARVAEFAGCHPDDVVTQHAADVYRVYMLGFLPGFAYMGLVRPNLAMPRRETPRLRVPAGSVGIAGRQTGVYPLSAPGGWRLIGRTPARVFDRTRDDPFLFHGGDAVTFTPVSAAELGARGPTG